MKLFQVRVPVKETWIFHVYADNADEAIKAASTGNETPENQLEQIGIDSGWTNDKPTADEVKR